MLPDCLESIKHFDEIVIVDTGSTDRTIEIAEGYGDVYHFKWIDDFAAARNFSLSKCTADWILIIDADERFHSTPTEVKKAIKKAKDKPFITVDVGICPGEQFDNPQYVQKALRILKRDNKIKYGRKIHNSLMYDGDMAKPRTMAYDSGLKMVSGFSPSHEKDPDRTFRLLKEELLMHPDSTRDMYYLATEYLHKKQDDIEALKLLQQYFMHTFPKPPWSNEFADACYLMATIYVNQRNWPMAMSAAFSSVMAWHTFKAPYEMISKLCEIGGLEAAAKYWGEIAEKATNEGVLIIR
jgi:glycosyltransferase involved in cell wall biosynthesis